MISMAEFIKIEDLKPHPENPREHTEEQIQKIAKSIHELDWGRPIIISKDNYILAGEGAYLAAKNVLKYKEVPFRRMKHMHDSPEAIAYMLADNKLNEESDWNYGKLQNIKNELGLLGFDASLTGFNEIELQEIDTKLDANKTEVKDDDFNPDEEMESICKLGDIWKLGEHRLMCGDSVVDKNKLIDGAEINLLLTDPPYGIDVVKSNQIGGGGLLGFKRDEILGKIGGGGIVAPRKYKPVLNDDKPFDPSFLIDLELPSIIFGANNFASKLPDNSQWLVWDKKMEENYKNTFSDVELAWTNFKGTICKIYRHLWAGLIRKGDRKTELHERVHPTQKPVGMLGEILKDYSKKNDKILDLFGGSGSTLIACEQLDRVCYMMELDPHYCDIIINRWEDFTGKTAIKIT